jgi:hypothetical protein
MAKPVSPLLTLPFEIRKMIWELTKPKAHKIFIMKEHPKHRGGHCRKKIFDAPPLLSVCRQIYAETHFLHKREVTVALINTLIADSWVPRMGYIRRNLITKFLFYIREPDYALLEFSEVLGPRLAPVL